MWSWIVWLGQHPAGKLALVLTSFLLLARLGRALYCGWKLQVLSRSLRGLAPGQEDAVGQAFRELCLERIEQGWQGYRVGLWRGHSGALALQAWTPTLWSRQLLAQAQSQWLPWAFCLASPWLAWQGLLAGWQRFQKEMAGLSALQPWEGIRAVQLTRHAVQSFFNWAEPGLAAALALLFCALLLGASGLILELLLELQLRAIGRQLQRLFPTRSESSSLEEIEKQLAEIRQLLLQMKSAEELS